MSNNVGKEYKTSIGGQALIEGIMMRGPSTTAIVVRTKEGLVEKIEETRLPKDRHPIFGFAFIRGAANLVSTMKLGVRSIMFSADQMPEEEQEEASKFDLWLEKKFGDEKAEKVIITFAVVMGLVLFVALFMLLPTLLTGFVARFVESVMVVNLIEGAFRITIFLTYIWLATKMGAIKRVWAYHGAEHKAIHCYEKGLPLTVDNVRDQSTLHPRCGTSFLFVVMLVSILIFSLTSWNNLLIRFALRIILLPVIVAISYEVIKLAGKRDNILTRIISAPGKALQRLTTREPDDDMIEVAIRAMELVVPEGEEEAEW